MPELHGKALVQPKVMTHARDILGWRRIVAHQGIDRITRQ